MDEKFAKKQRDHCFAQEAVDEFGRVTVWALGGFVPLDADAGFFEQSPPYRASLRNAKVTKAAIQQENEYRLEIVERMNKFLDEMDTTRCNVHRACKGSSISRDLAYALKRRVPAFSEQWDALFEAQTDELEAAGLERAIGMDEPIYSREGEQIGTRKVYSDRLLMMMLAGRRSDTYAKTAGMRSASDDVSDIVASIRAAVDATYAKEK